MKYSWDYNLIIRGAKKHRSFIVINWNQQAINSIAWFQERWLTFRGILVTANDTQSIDTHVGHPRLVRYW